MFSFSVFNVIIKVAMEITFSETTLILYVMNSYFNFKHRGAKIFEIGRLIKKLAFFLKI